MCPKGLAFEFFGTLRLFENTGIRQSKCTRETQDRKFSVRQDNRTGLTEAGYRPDRTLSPIVSDEGVFPELGNEDYEKRSRFLPQSGEKLFSLRHNLMNFDLHSQIQLFDAHTLFLS